MPDIAQTVTAGMFIKDAENEQAQVPLVGVSIDADISSFFAKVVVSHRYVNTESTPIEAVYVFPLDEGAAVCAFEALVDGTLVVGEVHERDKAFEIYDDAMEQGHGAFLLDEERPDVFQASIGNLPPGKEVIVKLTYVAELAVDEGRLRFVIPTTVSPRYAPAKDRVATGRSDAEALNPPTAFSVSYGMNLSVRVAMPGAISGIESPSHPISVKLNEREATVTLGQKEAPLDRDFVLSIDAVGLDVPHALIEIGMGDAERGMGARDSGLEAIGVAFAPTFTATSAPAELIFLVDRSGSMAGTSIEEVQNALQLCLRSMTSGCRFNIVGFGSRFESLFPEGSRIYDQSTLDIATKHVTAMQADLGGTELLPALQSVLEQAPSPELPRQVVIMTDGQVSNTDEIVALARAHAASARIFTFGIGAGASHHLVRGLARAGGGTAEFIYPGERIEPKVLRQVARLLSPALTDVRVEWALPVEARSAKAGGSVTQAPVRIPPVFAGGRLTVYGFVKGARPSNVRLTATSPSGPLSFDVPVSASVSSTRTVATLAARARIRELEEGDEWLSTRGSQQKDRKASGVRNEIIELSIRYGLMSRETSFVAVERRETPVIGDVKLRKVPIALTTGWGGLQRPLHVHMRALAAPMADMAPRMPGTAAMERLSASSSPSAIARAGALFNRVKPTFRLRVEEPRPLPVERGPSAMQRLIVLQAADGSWRLTKELASILERDLAQLRSAIDGATGSQDDVLNAWATALALEWLRRHAADVEDQWRLLATKGQTWLNRTPARPPGGDTWTDAAARFLTM